MRICFVDDNTTLLEYMESQLQEFQDKYNIPCSLSVYNSAEEMLFENQEGYPFDVIILDINMDGMNGIELARKIRQTDKKVPIAFLTAMADYVFDGYEVQAIRYLMKPIQQEQLFRLLELTYKELSREIPFLLVASSGDKIKVDYEDIYYVEAAGHYIYIYLMKNCYQMKGSINSIGKSLCSGSFVFTHRSYIVNLKHVVRICREECILSDGRRIPISRGLYKNVNDAFITLYKDGEF